MLEAAFATTLASAASAEDVARAVVASGATPTAAAGWAKRRSGSWHVGTGGADGFFDLASVTKPITALALARSRVPRETPIGELVEETRGTPIEKVSLELLLAHRAGLRAHVPLFEPLLRGATMDRAVALRTAATATREDARGAMPAEGFAPVYSDLGYILAGEALARSEGLVVAGSAPAGDIGPIVSRLVASPLGLDDELGSARALMERDVAFAERVYPTEVVAWRGGELRGVVHDENAWVLNGIGGSGHAGMFGTLSAVLRFACAVFDAVTDGAGALAGHDLSWLLRARPGGVLRAGFDGKNDVGSLAGDRCSARTFGHLGFTGTSFWIDPDTESVAVLLTNRVHPTRENLRIRAVRPLANDALFSLASSA